MGMYSGIKEINWNSNLNDGSGAKYNIFTSRSHSRNMSMDLLDGDS